MKIKKRVINLMNKLPYVSSLYRRDLLFKKNSCIPPGHFSSPIISVDLIKSRESEIWNDAEKFGINGIELRIEEQLKLLKDFSKYYNEIPFKAKKQINVRYYFENPWYTYNDGIILYSMIRHYKPQRIVEIGSGYSSAIMLDTNEIFFNNEIQLFFIEPYPDRLFSLMSENDKKSATIFVSDVQLVSLETFKTLQAGDILFVDSSHIVKTGSDVNHILFNILPILQSGVLIHFHDVFSPFEYPKEWVLKGSNWNEDYILKAFLMYNNEFEIRLFSEYIQKYYREAFNEMPFCYKDTGQNLWIEKK